MKMKSERWQIDRRTMLRDEIDSAVYLFFENNNLAAHVLAWAATDVMRPLLDRVGKINFLGEIEDRIRPEYIKDWRKILRKHYTYFKHSDRDPDDILEGYDPSATAIQILAATRDYYSLYGKTTVPMMIAASWVFSHNETYLKDEGSSWIPNMKDIVEFNSENSFAESLVPVREKLRLFRIHKEESFNTITDAIRDKYELS